MIFPRLRKASLKGTKKCLSVSLACAAACAFAHDADTIAFYPFTDGAVGMAASGITIHNDANDRHHGTVTMSTDTGVVFHADAPGKYVLASSFAANPTPEILYTNPRSVHFCDTGVISFDGLSTAISSNDDYTIEFFYKILEVDRRGTAVQWGTVLKYDVGTWSTGNASLNPPVAEGLYPTSLMRSTDTYWQLYYAGYSVGGTRTDALPYSGQDGGWNGEWHHLAIVYSKETRKLTVWSDYGARNRKASLSNVTNSVLDSSVSLDIGRGFRGLVSCLRISKRALTSDKFLHASNLDVYPETTVFHYKLDGIADEAATTITNYACGGHPYAGQFQDWDTTKQIKLYTGNAAVHVATSTNSLGEHVTVGAEWSALTGFNKSLVDDGTGAKPYANGGSGHFHSLERMHQSNSLDGSGILLQGADYQPVTNGSFTIEVTMNLDLATWLAKMKNLFRRYLIFGIYGGSTYHYNLQLAAIMDGDDCFRLTGYAYFPPTSNQTICNYNGNGTSSSPRVDKKFLKDNKWHHFALVYDDDACSFRLYVDYDLKDERSFSSRYRLAFPSTRDFWVGSGEKLNLSSFEGWIDEVRMTRKALSPEQFIRFMSPRGTTIIMW